MKIKFKYKEIEIPVKKLSDFGKLRGLMFRRIGSAEILLFEFSKPTRTIFHSLFCFFPFYILWLDDENNVTDWKICGIWKLKIVPKSTIKSFSKVIEIPINEKNSEYIKMFVEEKI